MPHREAEQAMSMLEAAATEAEESIDRRVISAGAPPEELDAIADRLERTVDRLHALSLRTRITGALADGALERSTEQ